MANLALDLPTNLRDFKASSQLDCHALAHLEDSMTGMARLRETSETEQIRSISGAVDLKMNHRMICRGGAFKARTRPISMLTKKKHWGHKSCCQSQIHQEGPSQPHPSRGFHTDVPPLIHACPRDCTQEPIWVRRARPTNQSPYGKAVLFTVPTFFASPRTAGTEALRWWRAEPCRQRDSTRLRPADGLQHPQT